MRKGATSHSAPSMAKGTAVMPAGRAEKPPLQGMRQTQEMSTWASACKTEGRCKRY
jgi:hypothetical protein